jgi:hypothetical protein
VAFGARNRFDNFGGEIRVFVGKRAPNISQNQGKIRRNEIRIDTRTPLHSSVSSQSVLDNHKVTISTLVGLGNSINEVYFL